MHQNTHCEHEKLSEVEHYISSVAQVELLFSDAHGVSGEQIYYTFTCPYYYKNGRFE